MTFPRLNNIRIGGSYDKINEALVDRIYVGAGTVDAFRYFSSSASTDGHSWNPDYDECCLSILIVISGAPYYITMRAARIWSLQCLNLQPQTCKAYALPY
eukprot:Em0001g3742a